MDSSTRTVEVRYDWDPRAKAWAAVTDTPGLTTFGRSLASAQAHARDAVATWLELPEGQSLDEAGVVIVDRVVLPGTDPEDIAGLAHLRDQVETQQASLAYRTGVAVRSAQARGVSLRDTATALGISHQRAQQLAGPTVAEIQELRERGLIVEGNPRQTTRFGQPASIGAILPLPSSSDALGELVISQPESIAKHGEIEWTALVRPLRRVASLA
ncbi:MAG: hypothetical protein LH650_13505 [Chloroflexi bacterium]|nr:hypothetical protein [Chloroflexota bacterium]